MADRRNFEGKIVRLERDGFGVIEFDQALGANTHGIFSSSNIAPGFPFARLKEGMHVSGTAEVDDRDLAAVKTLSNV
jgi:hypothetical protein